MGFDNREIQAKLSFYKEVNLDYHSSRTGIVVNPYPLKNDTSKCYEFWISPVLVPLKKNNYSNNVNYFRTVTHSAVLAYKGPSIYKQTNLTKWKYIRIKVHIFINNRTPTAR